MWDVRWAKGFPIKGLLGFSVTGNQSHQHLQSALVRDGLAVEITPKLSMGCWGHALPPSQVQARWRCRCTEASGGGSQGHSKATFGQAAVSVLARNANPLP